SKGKPPRSFAKDPSAPRMNGPLKNRRSSPSRERQTLSLTISESLSAPIHLVGLSSLRGMSLSKESRYLTAASRRNAMTLGREPGSTRSHSSSSLCKFDESVNRVPSGHRKLTEGSTGSSVT